MGDQFIFDHQIYFDESQEYHTLRPGEKLLITNHNVEDCKGNAGSLGKLQVTNIRTMWFANNNYRINLSIGHGTIFNQELKRNGDSHSIVLRTKLKNARYEFHFQSNDKQVFECFQAVFQLYQQSSQFREIKVSTVLTNQKNLILLPKENLINKYPNTNSLALDKTEVVGVLFLTNVRLAWFSLNNELFNISIPWISIAKIQKKSLKNGISILIETHNEFGGYMVGYKPADVETVFKDISKLKQVFSENPMLGIEYKEGNVVKQQRQQQVIQEEIDIVDTGYNHVSTKKAYALCEENTECEIIYSKQLGLAIEQLPDGQELKDLWSIIK